MAFTLSSCNTMNKSTLKGTYKYVGAIPKHVLLLSRTLEFTDTKLVLDIGMSMDYTIEDGYAYVSMGGVGGPQTRFKIVNTDTLSSDAMGCEGTYARVQP